MLLTYPAGLCSMEDVATSLVDQDGPNYNLF